MKDKQKTLSPGLFTVVGQIGETRVSVGSSEDGEDLIRLMWPSREIGLMALANLLAGKGEGVTLVPGQRWTTVEVVYSPEVDARIVQLVDVLAEIRLVVGQYVQLELELEVKDADRLRDALQPVLPGALA